MKKLLFLIAIVFFVVLSPTSFAQTSNGEISTIQNVEIGELNAMVKNIMDQTGITNPAEAVRMVNAGELQVSVIKPKWTENEGVIYLSVTSGGTTGLEWIARLEKKGYLLSSWARYALRSNNFKATSGVTYHLAILKGELFSDSCRTVQNIRKEAESRKLAKPNVEVACLVREKFSDKELKDMGLWWIVFMHELIDDCSDNNPWLLGISGNDRISWLGTNYFYSNSECARGDAFAFVASQVQLKKP